MLAMYRGCSGDVLVSQNLVSVESSDIQRASEDDLREGLSSSRSSVLGRFGSDLEESCRCVSVWRSFLEAFDEG